MKAPETAILLAAGRGQRMGALTDGLPKPLIEVAGRALIDHGLDRLAAAGVRRVVVNLSYRGDAIEAHLAGRRDIAIEFSREPAALETGGGIKKALPLLGDVFYALNADIVWFEGKDPALARLASGFDPDVCDALLLMKPTALATGYDGPGDFLMDPLGLPRRRGEREIAPYVFAGVEILHRRLFDESPEGAFSINRQWDRAIAAGRLRGLVHDGAWFHVGTPSGIAAAASGIAARGVKR
jgi:N-acetyl-alpha-D-muramate 1-phosphate uridylyltransferase